MKTLSCQSRGPHPRQGFTLIEMLAVIAILSILMVFLVPAVMRAGGNAKIVQTKTEMGNIAAAIATFKQEFGIEPPSRIVLQPAGGTWDSESTALISRMWPQFDFSTSGGASWTVAKSLNGAECLVFFLSGITDGNGDPIGFSRNPAAPFASASGNRLNPFYTFDKSRLIDQNSNGFFEYRDPLNATTVSPYIYFSSNDGGGYPTELDSTSSPTEWWTRDNWDSNAGSTPPFNKLMKFAYYSTVSTTGTIQQQAAGSRPHNPNSYQLISAGPDGRLGTGGLWVKGTALSAARSVERDNITNFSNGVLEP